ncbi:DUF4406 domain-containing protein [Ornithobacterium rhinotracheale]|uniref:DUF4406 domain-containing protein n=1 Tax=Ornithobacterium rhinotracheale TaxID=28251 RepID=UPI00129C7FB0|nr:DUF4406 domain-containing protein [Ornithobacterium rhinotracheale]MRJ11382.1 DUF4406 domain-containing protein [Ornithobacterium rhinotracheale]
MLKIYIAGKVTGEEPSVAKRKFKDAENKIKSIFSSAIVVNPIELVNDINMDWNNAMRICLNELSTCDMIYLLPCWKNSKGAEIERDFALNNKLIIYYQ